MNCSTASDLSLLENIEQRLQQGVSVSLLAELERELLRLRGELDLEDWGVFCREFPSGSLYKILQLGSMSDPYQLGAWEYSLPVSRSLRARKAYFSREIAETIRNGVRPRILVLGAGEMGEADEAIHAGHLHHAEFVAVEPDAAVCERLQRRYAREQVIVECFDWDSLPQFAAKFGAFDLIYSAGWLDSTDDATAASWLGATARMLRAGGRILATNFAPESHDLGWIEACWNWRPSYRSEEDLALLAMNLKQPEVRGHAVFRDESGASAYLEIHSL